MNSEAEEYHTKDFEWEELREEVERNPIYRHHLASFSGPSKPLKNPTKKQPRQSQEDQETQEQEQEAVKIDTERDNSKAWQRFHTTHSTGKFFKERRYLLKEFPELSSCGENHKVLLEIGCGNGSTVIPILRGNKNIIVYACDCSNETLEQAKKIIDASFTLEVKNRFSTFYCDFAFTGFPKWLACDSCREVDKQKQQEFFSDFEKSKQSYKNFPFSQKGDCCIGGIDFITLIFTLSAVPYEKMPTAVMECFSVLKPGGLLFFRDYGLYDMTMLRFEPEKRVGFREYMRSDGTRSYFFSEEVVRDLFVGAGFLELELGYCCINSVNRRKGTTMRRVWVHGKFQKPHSSSKVITD